MSRSAVAPGVSGAGAGTRPTYRGPVTATTRGQPVPVSREPATMGGAALPPELSPRRPGRVVDPGAAAPPEARTTTQPPRPPGLTARGALVVATATVGLGCALDLVIGGELGTGFHAMFLLACVLVPIAVTRRSLAAAVIGAPLLYAAACILGAVLAGQSHGIRQVALDVATMLALSAPTLFAGTAVAAVIAATRLAGSLVRR